VQFRPVARGEAAGDGYLQVRLLSLPPGQQSERADDPVLGALSHDAGVEYHDVRLVHPGHVLVSGSGEQPGDSPGFCLVHLAADGPEVVVRHTRLYSGGKDI
jgi:hypothetical protein